MEKVKVDIVDTRDGEIFERLLLTEEQIRLLEYLENRNILDNDAVVRIMDEDIPYKEI